jgi:ubiquinone/menaquinone biosynthesis C-methylase UbiE
MITLHQKYEQQNIQQDVSPHDPFTLERYEQFYKFFPEGASRILDVGCNTGRGGVHLKKIDPSLTLCGLDCVQTRLESLPECYSEKIYGLSTDVPIEDRSVDVIAAGEFLQCLYPSDVDRTLCEFQRVLKSRGRLLITIPNPNYIKDKIYNLSIYDHVGQLSQHFPDALRTRLLMHGFSKIKILGSGKVSRYLGWYFPIISAYGSYLIVASKH